MIGGNSAEAAPAPNAALEDELVLVDTAEPVAVMGFEDDEEEVPTRSFGWLAPPLALLVSAAWLGAMLWLALPSIRAGLEPIALIELIAALCIPPALIGILYLLS